MTQTPFGGNIRLRGAAYFGLDRWPRRSFLLGRRQVLTVARTNIPGVTFLAYYEERERGVPRGDKCNVIGLIDEQRVELAEALRDA